MFITLLCKSGVLCRVFGHLHRGVPRSCGAGHGQVCRAVEQDGPIASEKAETQLCSERSPVLHSSGLAYTLLLLELKNSVRQLAM